ncbi:MAG: alpha/beta-type small acid-soluble spore protein [Clostridia bacterium]|nr:alpha/beta-type small acid-soluble spore protein [Clostridia bacterium]
MNQSGSSSSNRVNVPEARGALDNMKFEIARELGINFKQGYNGDLTSRENGYVGGYMVKRLIEQAEKQMAGK